MGQLEKGAISTWGMSGQEIFFNFTAADAGPTGLNDGVQQLMRVSQDQYDDVEELHALAVKLESAWQGTAADAAQRGLTPFAIEHETSADALWEASSLMSDQSGAFSSAKGGVVPVPPMPDKPAAMKIFTEPSALTTFNEHATATDAAGQHNVSVMQGYEAASDRNTVGLPSSYGKLAPDSASVVVEQAPSTQDKVPRPRSRTPRVSQQPPTHQVVAKSPTRSAPATKPDSPIEPGAPAPGSDTVTHPGSHHPDVAAPASAAAAPGRPVGGDGGRTGTPLGGMSPEDGLGAQAEAWRGSGEPVTGRPGTGRAGDTGAPTTGRPRTGTAEPMGGSRAPGTTEAMAERGGARGGVTGGVPMGAGNRRGQDEERERFGLLLEPEPEDLFGTDEVTAPSVIE